MRPQHVQVEPGILVIIRVAHENPTPRLCKVMASLSILLASLLEGAGTLTLSKLSGQSFSTLEGWEDKKPLMDT